MPSRNPLSRQRSSSENVPLGSSRPRRARDRRDDCHWRYTARNLAYAARPGASGNRNENGMTRTRLVVLASACVLTAAALVAGPVEQIAAVSITKDPHGYWFAEGDTKVL